MIKLDKDGNVSGAVVVGDNYAGMCCPGHDCTVTYKHMEKTIYLQCENDNEHCKEYESGDFYAGVVSKQIDDIIQHLADEMGI